MVLFLNYSAIKSSLIYNTSARHERHECDTSNISETRVRHKCDTSATRTTRLRHKCYTNETSVTRVKQFDFDSGTSKNILLHPYIYYMANDRLQGEKQFLWTTFLKCLVSMRKCVWKVHHKNFWYVSVQLLAKYCKTWSTFSIVV